MPTNDENRSQGEGTPNTSAPLAQLIGGAILVIASFITLIAKFKDVVGWSLPIKILALAVALIAFVVSLIYIRKKDYRSGFASLILELFRPKKISSEENVPELLVKTICFGSIGFISIVIAAYFVSIIPAPKSPSPSDAEEHYYMVVLDASEKMNSAFGDQTEWEAALAAVKEILGHRSDRSHYGLVIIGGQNPGENSNDPCRAPSKPIMPLVSEDGNNLPPEELQKGTLLSKIEQQRPSGGGSFDEAFSLAMQQLDELRGNVTKTLIFIVGSSDTCENENEWEALKREIWFAQNVNMYNVYSEIIVLDENANPLIEEFANEIYKISITADASTGTPLIGTSDINIQVANTTSELQESIDFVTSNLDIHVGQRQAIETATSTNLPSHSPSLATRVTTVVPIEPMLPTSTSHVTPYTPTRTSSPTVTPPSFQTRTFTPVPPPTLTPTFTFTPSLTPLPTATPPPVVIELFGYIGSGVGCQANIKVQVSGSPATGRFHVWNANYPPEGDVYELRTFPVGLSSYLVTLGGLEPDFYEHNVWFEYDGNIAGPLTDLVCPNVPTATP